MELLNERIKKWLTIDNYDGSGYGSGSGFGDGSDFGFGGDFGGNGGSGSGYGSGSGFGDIFGGGSGSGFGFGGGSDSGYGFGGGSDSGLKSINGQPVWLVDEVPTIINAISKNVAKGFILNSDLTMKPCYIVKSHNKFAHGETIKQAAKDLEEKIYEDINTEEAIKEFTSKFSKNKKYKGTTFYKWHHILTGSCTMGRDSFVKNHQLNLNKLYTVKEFIELTENDYGGEIIKQLKEKLGYT